MAVDRFTSVGPRVTVSGNLEKWHEFSDTLGDEAPEINTVGPWTGLAVPPDAFGLNPATGERFYVDPAGEWQPVPAIVESTQEVVAGNAPAMGVIPTEVSSLDRDDGDYHTIQYDDYIVVYTFPDAEARRSSTGDGGFEQVIESAPATLEPPLKDGWLREYTLTATAPLVTITVNGVSVSVVENTLPAPTADGQRIDVIRSSTEMQYLNGNVNNDATGGVINQDNRKIQLVSLGATWLWSH